MENINVGDTLYDTFGGMVEKQTVTSVSQTRDGVKIYTEGCFSEGEYDESAIGKDVFMDLEAATSHCKDTYGRVMMVVQDFDEL